MKTKKRVQVTQYGFIHYHAGCNDCDFSAAIFTDETLTAREVRQAVCSHVIKTGHKCWIEGGTHTDYEQAERQT